MVQTLLAKMGTSMVRKKHQVQFDIISGWGGTGVSDTSTETGDYFSTEKLQETEVPIVQSSKCVEKMDDAEGVVESLIVCTEGAGAGKGPCKVFLKVSW